MADGIYFGKAEQPVLLTPKFGNRHGLIAGATGTGKTVSLQTLAEGFSRLGVPVFMADVKGDLAGISQPGGGNPKLEARAEQIGYSLEYCAFPVMFWDLYGEQGHPIRATVSEMGPLLLSRLLELNETQEGVLNVAFKYADDNGLVLLDLKDLRAMLQHVADHSKELTTAYGNVSSATIGAIQRSLLVLEQQGAEQFFGEPALDLHDLMRVGSEGRGTINILAADRLMQSPRLYSTFLLWLLSELFEALPEVGDPDQPKLVFFFDEAHLLFTDAPKALLEKIEQVVRLIRSKGVGVYFITQNPIDVPDTVLAQLGNRVQHALRAFTPRDQKAVRASAETFRPNPAFSTEEIITQLAVGEALVSFLEEKGTPMVVQRTLVAPPSSRLGTVTPDERQRTVDKSPCQGKYEEAVDRESAYEVLAARAEAAAQEAEQAPAERQPARTRRDPNSAGEIIGSMAKSLARSAGTQLGRQLIRGVLGGLFKGR
ncbi:MAG: DUF853 family protein [Armatimonadetes bacterium]|nr:DUF853 family protein [Armatimonadota bacterium]